VLKVCACFFLADESGHCDEHALSPRSATSHQHLGLLLLQPARISSLGWKLDTGRFSQRILYRYVTESLRLLAYAQRYTRPTHRL